MLISTKSWFDEWVVRPKQTFTILLEIVIEILI